MPVGRPRPFACEPRPPCQPRRRSVSRRPEGLTNGPFASNDGDEDDDDDEEGDDEGGGEEARAPLGAGVEADADVAPPPKPSGGAT